MNKFEIYVSKTFIIRFQFYYILLFYSHCLNCIYL